VSAGFTPGPWRWHGEQLTGEHFTVARKVEWWNGDREANARLIAVAPELYEALWKIARVEFNCSPHQRFMAAQAIAEEAIAKARGDA
jgi:hypothetical protein